MPSFSAIASVLALMCDGGEAFQFQAEDDKLRRQEVVDVVLAQDENPHCNHANPEYFGCPCDENYHESCHLLMPPYPTCLKGTLSEWVGYAQHDGGPNCCGDDLTNCTCPVKNSDHFVLGIAYACQQIESCTQIYRGLQATKATRADLALLEKAMKEDYPELYFQEDSADSGTPPYFRYGTAQYAAWRAVVDTVADSETA